MIIQQCGDGNKVMKTSTIFQPSSMLRYRPYFNVDSTSKCRPLFNVEASRLYQHRTMVARRCDQYSTIFQRCVPAGLYCNQTKI